MSIFKISLEGATPTTIEIHQGDMKIGRKPECEIYLDNLSVSSEHANIYTIGPDSFIHDLKSTNGTFVNTKRVSKHHLKHGDQVQIGKYNLIYHQQPEEASGEEPENTRAITTPESGQSRSTGPSSMAGVGPAALVNLGSGKRIELTRTITSLGRGSRRAGSITRTAEGYVLAPGDDDIPKLNGRIISGVTPKLRNGDVIEVAGARLQFHIK